MKIFKGIIGALCILILLWACGFGAFSYFSLTKTIQDPAKQTQAIIVLTGGRNRIETGLRLFAAGGAPQLFITGVKKGVTKAHILGRWTGEDALPACCITLGYKAQSTVQNAQETREWLEVHGFRSIRMVTGDYHILRAQMEMAHALPGITIYAHPVKQDDLKLNHELLGDLLISEYHKSLYRWVALWLEPRTPLNL